MAEFDPLEPNDAAEAAYRDALLGDDDGREQRRARLMAALPRPESVVAVPVSRAALAWRWRPYALVLLATGLLLAAVLAWRGAPTEPKPEADPRLSAAPAASTAAVVAQANPVAEVAPTAAPPRAAAKATPAKPRTPPPVVMADAAAPAPPLEREVVVAAAPAPVAPVAPPPPAAPVVASVSPHVMAEAVAPAASYQAEALARLQADASARAKTSSAANSLAASAAAELRAARALSAADGALLKAVVLSDPAAARSAVQAGASVHQRDALGRTMLMLAARAGADEVVDVLLAAGARVTDRDAQGWTAAEHARDRGHEDLAARLR